MKRALGISISLFIILSGVAYAIDKFVTTFGGTKDER